MLSPTRPPDPPFFRALGAGALPLALWALHFTVCYALAVIGCSDAEGRPPDALSPATTRAAVLAVSALAVGVAAALLARACLRGRHERGRGLLATVRVAASALALTGIVWTTVPALPSSACRGGDVPVAAQARTAPPPAPLLLRSPS